MISGFSCSGAWVALEDDAQLTEAYESSLLRIRDAIESGYFRAAVSPWPGLDIDKFSDLVSEGLRNVRELRETQTDTRGEREVLPSNPEDRAVLARAWLRYLRALPLTPSRITSKPARPLPQ